MTRPCVECREPMALEQEAVDTDWFIGRCPSCGVKNYVLVEGERVVVGQIGLPLPLEAE